MSKKSQPNNNRKGGPTMIDVSLLLQAGIDPKTLKPIRAASAGRLSGIKDMLEIIDEQNAVNIFTWYNLPGGLTGQDVERMLYLKGQLAFFYFEDLKSFYFMPFALDGSIDFYGRYNTVHPVPFTSGKDNAKKRAGQEAALSELKLDCLYDIVADDDEREKKRTGSCVILRDYVQAFAQEITPRFALQKDIIKFESEVLPFARTALIASIGTRAVRVTNSEESPGITIASKQIYDAAMNGEVYVPVQGAIDFQDLANKPSSKSEDYLEIMQAVDNFRLSAHGLENGGLFQKKAHKLQSEQDMNGAPTSTVLADRTALRQNFCNIVNSVWGLGVWCEPSQGALDVKDLTPEEQTGDDGQKEGGEGYGD